MGLFMLKCSVQTERGEESRRKRQTERYVQRERNRNRQSERQPKIERSSEEERKRQIGIPTMTGTPHRQNKT